MASDIRREEIGSFYRRIIGEYVKMAKINETEMVWLKATRSIHDVIKCVEKVRDQRERKKKHRLTRFLQRFSGSILDRFDRFSTIIETLTSSHPEVAALVWGSLKLVLMVSAVAVYAENSIDL